MRRLSFIFIGLSQLLSAALIVFWIRSYSSWDLIGRVDERVPQQSSTYAMWSGKGSFWLFHEGYDATLRQRDTGPDLSWYFGRNADAPSTMIFDPNLTDADYHEGHQWITWDHSGNRRDGFFIFACPYWFALILAAAPAVGLILTSRIRRALRVRKGRCPRCGYNLTANTSGVCPECGTAAEIVTPSVIRASNGEAVGPL